MSCDGTYYIPPVGKPTPNPKLLVVDKRAEPSGRNNNNKKDKTNQMNTYIRTESLS